MNYLTGRARRQSRRLSRLAQFTGYKRSGCGDLLNTNRLAYECSTLKTIIFNNEAYYHKTMEDWLLSY